MKSFKQHLTEADDKVEDISHYKKSGEQLGTNPGGTYTNGTEKHYVKFPENEQHARSEVAAGKIYRDIGVHTLNHRLVKHNGKLGVASQWNSDIKEVHPKEKFSDPEKHQLARHFVGAVLTKNWDAVGISSPYNIARHKTTGNLHNVDLGGSFKFRAMGGHKDYGPDIAEHDSLRKHEPAASVFNNLSHDHIKAAVHGANLDYKTVHGHFKDSGVSDPEGHAKALMGRHEALKKLYK